MEKIENLPQAMLMVLVGAAAFLALLPAWINYDIISMDGASQYVPMARLLLKGNVNDVLTNYPQLPLFPLIIACIAKLTGFDPEFSGRLASYIGFIATALGMFKLSELLFKNRLISILAVTFLITNRQLITRSIDCLKETLFLCCIIWGNYLILKGLYSISRKQGFFVGGVLVLIIGALFRSTSLVFLCAWLVIWIIHERKGRYSRLAVLLTSVVGLFSFWFINPEMLVFQKSCYNIEYILTSFVRTNDFFKSVVNVAATFFSVGNPAIIFFGLYGLYHRSRDAYFYHVCLVVISFFLILVFWWFASKRYFFAPVIWMYPLAAYGVAHALKSSFKSMKVFSSLSIFICVVFWLHISVTPPDPDRLAWKEAGTWILTTLGSNHEIVSNRYRLVFYAQGLLIPLSEFQEKGDVSIHQIIAVDAQAEGGGGFISRMHSLGYKPIKRFRSISVYLPRA